MDETTAYRLWLAYDMPYLRNPMEKPLAVVDFDLFVQEPRAQLERIARAPQPAGARRTPAGAKWTRSSRTSSTRACAIRDSDPTTSAPRPRSPAPRATPTWRCTRWQRMRRRGTGRALRRRRRRPTATARRDLCRIARSLPSLGALVVGAAGFGLAKILEQPADGNPVGFKLAGKAFVDVKTLNLAKYCSAAAQCTLVFNISIGKAGGTPNPADCVNPASCAHFHSDDMMVSSSDDNVTHPQEHVKVLGAVEAGP